MPLILKPWDLDRRDDDEERQLKPTCRRHYFLARHGRTALGFTSFIRSEFNHAGKHSKRLRQNLLGRSFSMNPHAMHAWPMMV
jgi:hypothetical protein